MRLTDLDPHWVGAGGEGITRNGQPVPERHGVGLTFNCPCGCDARGYVAFENPLDGGPPHESAGPHWRRSGDTFETLTLTPSILRSRDKGGCGWHGFITNGEGDDLMRWWVLAAAVLALEVFGQLRRAWAQDRRYQEWRRESRRKENV